MELVPTPATKSSVILGKSLGKGEEERNAAMPLYKPVGSSQLKYCAHLGSSNLGLEMI